MEKSYNDLSLIYTDGVSLQLHGVTIPNNSLVDIDDLLYRSGGDPHPTNANGLHNQTWVVPQAVALTFKILLPAEKQGNLEMRLTTHVPTCTHHTCIHVHTLHTCTYVQCPPQAQG